MSLELFYCVGLDLSTAHVFLWILEEFTPDVMHLLAKGVVEMSMCLKIGVR